MGPGFRRDGKETNTMRLAREASCALVLLAALALTPAAHALDQIRAAKAVGIPWTFTLLDVGIEEGIFAKYGLDVESSDLNGDASLHQALIAGSVDVALGSGPS